MRRLSQMARRTTTLLLQLALFLLPSITAPGQSPTTGRVAGNVTDQNGAVVVGAEVTVSSKATGYQRIVTTNQSGTYSVSLLPPGFYQIRVTATGFTNALIDTVQVVITENTVVNVNLAPAGVTGSVIVRIGPLQTDGPQLGRVVDARAVSDLPLATRNYSQILGLSPGTATYLPDNSGVGRNSQTVSVNGARVTQNNVQLNGIDINT